MIDEYDLEAIDTMDVTELRDSLYDLLIKYRIMETRAKHLEEVIRNIANGKALAE